ncbi:immunity 8 family protein [Burkholderia sp. MSMB1072]|uniref:immunity 8 family protein n=1 Tax=Burkholderia sp. MSMB1072 TaxID=1637871 RepID=UPI0009E9DCFC|nr:immunity 8 family protein [Burkholderia sp. MSMB1072]
MQAIVKDISNGFFDLKTFVPDDPHCFDLLVRICIGRTDTVGADDFYLNICTPEWLAKNIWQPTWGRHMLIVREYNLSVIEKFIGDYVATCQGDKWNAIGERLGRMFAWEFEDYKR